MGWELFDLNLRCCLLLSGRSKAAHTAGSRGAVSHGGALAAWGRGEPAFAPTGVSHGVHEKLERKREVSGNGGVQKHHPSHGRIEVFWAPRCQHLL